MHDLYQDIKQYIQKVKVILTQELDQLKVYQSPFKVGEYGLAQNPVY